MLDIQRLTVHYGQAPRPALAELDFRVEGGDIVAIIGPSGAGKSTILGAAAGLVLPSEGRVEVLGVDTAVLGARRHRPVRSRIGTIQQDFALVGPMRVVHNVAAGRLGRWSAARALRSLIKPVEIDDVVASLDRVGLADRVWDRADRLSGGQQQRVAVARTLFQDPDLILADEPCSSVDPARADDVLAQLVATASKGDRALVTSLHDAQLATRHCGRIVGIKMGAVHFDLPAGDVTEGRLAELYSLEDSSVLEDDPPVPTDSAEPGT